MGEYYFGRIFLFKILLKFKALMPLFANLIFKEWAIFVSVLSHTLTALNNLFAEMSKIILWSRCSGDAASAKCSRVACSREGSTVSYEYDEENKKEIWPREKGRDLTQSYDKSPYTNRNVKRAKWQHKQRHKKVRLNSGCCPMTKVLWQNPLYQQNIRKPKDNTHKRYQKVRLHNDCGPT